MNDKAIIPQKLDSVANACSDAEIEFALVEKMQKQLVSDVGNLPTKLEGYVNELEKLSLKTLRGNADIQLINVRGALNKLKKSSSVEKRISDVQEQLDVVAAARAKLDDLKTLVDQANTLIDGVKDFNTKADDWDKHKLRYAIRTELDKLREYAVKVIEQAEEGKIEVALKTFESGKQLIIDANVKLKIAANETPSSSDIGQIISREGGMEQLDEMIKDLDESTARKVVKVAFEKRFGCKLQMLRDKSFDKDDAKWDGSTMARQASGRGRWVTHDDDEKSPDLRRFYEVMSKLPSKHTKDNDKLQNFRYRDSDESSSSWAWSKYDEIVMNEGRADKSGIYGCAKADEVPEDVKDECKPANDEPITYFDWNTAHEVGHTLDAKLSFMSSRGNQSNFAGWREYHGDSSEVAEAMIGHYKYDPAYIRDLLNGGNPVAPLPPSGSDDLEWNEKKSLVDAHYEKMKAANNPWSSHSTAKSLAIDGRVYQQSYDAPTWSSYELAARQEAITGYQFRSPLEWFSELYAAFKCDKLKPSHPAMAWLQRLDEQ